MSESDPPFFFFVSKVGCYPQGRMLKTPKRATSQRGKSVAAFQSASLCPGPPRLGSQTCISALIRSVTTQHGAQTQRAHTKSTRKRWAYRHSSGSSYYVCVLEEACMFAGYLLVCLSAGSRLFYPICTGTLRAHMCVKKHARPYRG